MMAYLGRIGDAVLDLTPGALIGSLIVALMVGMVGSGLFALARGRTGRGSLSQVCGLMTAAGLASMLLAAGIHRPARESPEAGSVKAAAGGAAGRVLLDRADLDRDGHLTPREAAEFVMHNDTNRKGFVDAFDLDHAASRPGPASTRPDGRRPWPARPEPAVEACYPEIGGPTGHERRPILGGYPFHPPFPRG